MYSLMLSNHLIQYMASSFYVCLLLSILIEASFKLFRLNNDRFRAMARLLLPLKLLLDSFSLLWPKKWMLINVNIFGCTHPLQNYFFKKFCGCPETAEKINGLNTFLGKTLLKIPVEGHQLFIACFLCLSILRLLQCCLQYLQSWYAFRLILNSATPIVRSIENLKLAQQLSRYRCTLVSSTIATAPFAGSGNVIVIPKQLLTALSQQEFEAILSHELEHLKWRDSAARFFCHALSAIYWWIPLKSWFKAIEHDQELACDKAIHAHNINGINLASALKKTLQNQLNTPNNHPAFANRIYLSAKENLIERFRLILLPRKNDTIKKSFLALAVIITSTLTIGFTIC